ncbi:hypothetical protein [Pseudonocardia endophytica]|uniref:Uncharacterized protein n=1 Tax=Pseudonocardia endophytica TaxID=401976 RepID=A0A4R1HM12_PSEEN|nr:hypothetical protein [Pseudonocardia endophytica]TCK21565.1 hypothetical protein EV378_5553 [Pseudonocardia endophytica]
MPVRPWNERVAKGGEGRSGSDPRCAEPYRDEQVRQRFDAEVRELVAPAGAA